MENTITKLRAEFREGLKKLYSIEESDATFFWLMEELEGLKRHELAMRPLKTVDDNSASEIRACLTKLIEGVPVQQLLGYSYFMGRRFLVDSSVLIPRPETEELCAWILQRHGGSTPGLRIMDVGTGSGSIAISLALGLQDSRVHAMDISPEALILARRNTEALNASVAFMEADILEWDSVFPEDQVFDVMVSNPPYITQAEKGEMHPNVLQYEPHLALFVEGNAPLVFYDHIADFARAHLSENGSLYFEVNRMYGAEVAEMLVKKGFKSVELKKDMQGADRMIAASR